MSDFLYGLVKAIANIHSLILSLNDAYEYTFTPEIRGKVSKVLHNIATIFE